MKTNNLLLLQSVLLILVLIILIDSLIKFPDIETVHIIIRAICVGIVSGNFSYALYLYLHGK